MSYAYATSLGREYIQSYLKVWLSDIVLSLVIGPRREIIDLALALHLVSAEFLVGEGVLLVQRIPSRVVVEFVSLKC